MSQSVICLIIFIATLVLYAINKFSIGAVALVSMILLVLSGSLDPATAVGYFGNPNGLITIGMFIVVTGFSRTQLVNKLAAYVYKVSGGSFLKCMRILIVIYFLTIPFINSGLARIIMFYPVIAKTCEKFDVSISKALYPFGMIGMMGLTRIPIGQTAVLHLRNNAQLEAFGITDYAMTVTDFFKACLPGALVILVYCLVVAFKRTPDQPVTAIGELDTSKKDNRPPLKPFQEFCGYAIFFLTSLGIIISDSIGVPAWVIVLSGAVLTHLTGVLTAKEVQNAIPLRMFLLFVGSMCLASAMVQSGASEIVGNWILALVGDIRNGYIVGAVFFIVCILMTQVLQNSATIQTMIPIGIMAAMSMNANPITFIILVTIACSCCIFTPMATPSVAIIMSAGGYDIKTLVKQGLPPVIIYTIVNVLWVCTVFPMW